MPTLATRIFMNGNSQAVCIPQEFRLNARRVEISRTAQGDLLSHPVPADRGLALLEALRAFDDDFVAALEADSAGQPSMQISGLCYPPKRSPQRASQPLIRNMGINLGRADTLMPQQPLHIANINARFQ